MRFNVRFTPELVAEECRLAPHTSD